MCGWGGDGKECVTVPSVFAIGDGVEAELYLQLHDFLDRGVFEGDEILLGGGPFVNGSAGLEEVVGAQEGAEMFGSERRIAVVFAGHAVYLKWPSLTTQGAKNGLL